MFRLNSNVLVDFFFFFLIEFVGLWSGMMGLGFEFNWLFFK